MYQPNREGGNKIEEVLAPHCEAVDVRKCHQPSHTLIGKPQLSLNLHLVQFCSPVNHQQLHWKAWTVYIYTYHIPHTTAYDKMIIIYGGHTRKKPASRTYTLAEVSLHTTREDLWMVIRGKVYDITSLIDKHPGGSEVLFGCAGVDATSAFDDVSHSDYAFSMLTPCYVGEVDEKDLLVMNGNLNVNQAEDELIIQENHTRTDANHRRRERLKRSQLWERVSMEVLILLALLALISLVYLQRRRWLEWTS